MIPDNVWRIQQVKVVTMEILPVRQWLPIQKVLSTGESEQGSEVRHPSGKGLFVRILFALSVLLCAADGAVSLEGSQNGNSIVLFSQGRAPVDPQNREGSRQEAVRDFLVQAVIQAASRILSPSELETRYPSLSEGVFAHPERYILSYKISSEVVDEGNLVRIAGQVSIAMDLLGADLPHGGPSQSGSPSVGVPRVAHESPGTTHGVEASAGDLSGTGAAVVTSGSKKVLWSVAEHWGEGWQMPRGGVDPEASFAGFISQEVEDFGWSLIFPPPDFPQPEGNGSVALEAVLLAARTKGATHAVLGTFQFHEKRAGIARLSATLSVLNVASGNRDRGFDSELSIDEGPAEEKAMELAALVVPRLDRMLGQVTAGGTLRPGEETKAVDRPVLPKGEGLILRLRSKRPQADWEEIEGIIRRKAGSIQILGFRFDREGGACRFRQWRREHCSPSMAPPWKEGPPCVSRTRPRKKTSLP